LPEGFAQRIPAGSKIVFQMHYTPTGKPETDLTKLGLVFADRAQVTHEVYALAGIEQNFEIPPRDSDYTVVGTVGRVPKDGYLLSVMPHMHLRGKSFRMDADLGDRTETLLEVPAYDFNWQHSYELSEPMPLDSVQSLRFEATFDNSSQNPFNPDPDEAVTWGDQTWQEMAVTFLSVAKPFGDDVTQSRPPLAVTSLEDESALKRRLEVLRREASRFADRYIERLDADGDGVVAAHELPTAVRRYGHLDSNRDGYITRAELIEHRLSRPSVR
jgi:hypothetical protein